LFLTPSMLAESSDSNLSLSKDCEVRKLPTAYVLLNTEIGEEREVLTTIRKTEGVQEAFNLMGIYDIIARVKADSMDGLKKIINEKLQINKVH
jgi:DNA-binding Lrp family transcriptional regulator